MKDLGIIKRDKTAFVMIDIQDKFIPIIHEIDKVIKNSNILIKSAEILKIPLVTTEQYPQGLGKTNEKILLSKDNAPFEKIEFSCFGCKDFANKIKEVKVDTLVVFGIETHVCVVQTVLDALELGYKVHVVEDAISSRTLENKKIGVERMRQSGAFIVSTEMILFQLMKNAGVEGFREISNLVK
jgi:nicotinamidase-related amidase